MFWKFSNKKIKKILTNKISILLFGIIIGALWYKHKLPPIPLINKINLENSSFYKKLDLIPSYEEANLTYSRYSVGVPLFLDRSYSEILGDERLEGLYLIQINRHEKRNLLIKTNSPITIYRLVPKENTGLIKNSYEKTNINVMVRGLSTDHIHVLKKNFKPGSITLSPGGPTASSPILFSFDRKLPNLIIEKKDISEVFR